MTDNAIWTATTIPIDGGRRYSLLQSEASLSFREMLRLWSDVPLFGDWYSTLLRNAGCPAFFWEHPPLTRAYLDNPAEFVLLDAPGLEGIRADPSAFREPLRSAPEGPVATFPNLGGDATLVVPRPVDGADRYGHLGDFLRHAPVEQVRELWRVTGRALTAALGQAPLWLSTSGLGVPWVHVRLDSRPKYYQHRPYARMQ